MVRRKVVGVFRCWQVRVGGLGTSRANCPANPRVQSPLCWSQRRGAARRTYRAALWQGHRADAGSASEGEGGRAAGPRGVAGAACGAVPRSRARGAAVVTVWSFQWGTFAGVWRGTSVVRVSSPSRRQSGLNYRNQGRQGPGAGSTRTSNVIVGAQLGGRVPCKGEEGQKDHGVAVRHVDSGRRRSLGGCRLDRSGGFTAYGTKNAAPL
jgi:hypothetical protein